MKGSMRPGTAGRRGGRGGPGGTMGAAMDATSLFQQGQNPNYRSTNVMSFKGQEKGRD